MDMNEIIKILEQAIEAERAELKRLTQMYLEKNKSLSEDANLINISSKLDEMVCDLHRRKSHTS